MDADEIEAEFEHLVGSDPTAALAEVDGYLDRYNTATSATDGLARMLRNAALAARSTRDLTGSNAFLDRAFALPRSSEDKAGGVRLQLTKSYNLLLLGDHEGAVGLVSSLDGGDDPHLQTQIKFQWSTILGRLTRNGEAVTMLTDALGSVVETDDRYLHSQILKNRGMFNSRDGRYADAVADIRAAGEICREIGLEFEAAFCEVSLGIAASQAGDLPLAFAQFDLAEPKIRELSGSDFESKTGHCKALLFGGLFREAAEMAGDAARQCEEADFMVDAADTRMLEAVALLEAGEPDLAATSASNAAAAFKEQNREGWRAAAETVLFLVDHRAGRPVDVAQLRHNIAQLEEFGLRNDTLEAKLLLVEILTDQGSLEEAESAFDSIRAAIDASTMDLRLAGAATEVLLLQQRSKIIDALRVAERGYGLLTEQQALIGASDLRVGLRQHGDRLGRFGIQQSLAADDPTAALAWIERTDLATNTPRPVRPPQDPQMQEALTKLRALEDDDPGQKRRLEDNVRTLERSQTAASGPIVPATAEELTDHLGPAAAVSYGVDDGQLFACALIDGRTQIHHLGPIEDVLRLTRAVRADMRRRSVRRGTSAAATERSQLVLQRLDDLLLGPLATNDRPLVLTPTPQLFSVPWNSLSSRVGHRTNVVTSLTAWSTTAEADRSGPAVLVAGPDLDHALGEVLAIDTIAAAPTVLTDARATAPAVLDAIDGAAVAHLVAHGTVRADNPLFSSLQMADGELSVYELGDLQQAPNIVVLSACHVGLLAEAPGQELLGMVTGFLNVGSSCVVASTLPVPDNTSTIEMMSRFHRVLRDGLSPAAAWAEVQRTCENDEQLLDTATFTIFGRG